MYKSVQLIKKTARNTLIAYGTAGSCYRLLPEMESDQ